MSEAPENFIIPTQYGQAKQGVANVSAYSGQAAGRPFRFFLDHIKNENKSNEQGLEVKDATEMVEFINDEKSTYAHRIDASLFQTHPEILGEYEKWKAGKSSGITEIKEWDAISFVEMGTLISQGFYSVEQIHDSSDEKLHCLGLLWKDIKNKAKLHMNTKNKERGVLSETEEFTKIKLFAQESNARSEAMQAEMQKMREEMEAMRNAKPSNVTPKTTVTKKPTVVRTPGVQS